MFARIPTRLRLVTLLVLVLAIALSAATPVLGAPPEPPWTVTAVQRPNPYFTVEKVTLKDGTQLQRMIIDGPPKPPPGFVRKQAPATALAGDVKLAVPAYSWVFGCSAVSASMVAAYWDLKGFSNMYAGPTSGGIMPMDNSGWPTWTDLSGSSYPSNPLTASRSGLDGRVSKGSIDDYWVSYGSSASDPYITGQWNQHAWGDAVGDYMWTSQSAAGNTDGSTTFWGYSGSTKLTCAAMEAGGYQDGTVGRKHFYEARGYTVNSSECYNQATNNIATGGFSFAQYKAKIDAGYPVFLNLAGHSIVGVGYNATLSPPRVYLNETWDWNSGTEYMDWGGSYSGMQLQSVSIVEPILAGTVPGVNINDVTVKEGYAGTTTPANFTVSLSAPSSSQVTVKYATADGTAKAGTDYVAKSGTVTFAAGVTSQIVTVQVNGDSIADGDKTYYVNLTNPSGATLAKPQGIGTILDAGGPPALHVASMTGSPSSGRKNTWSATVTIAVQDATNSKVSGAKVTATWSVGTVSCTTDTTGACRLSKSNLTVSSITLTVNGVSKSGYTYDSSSNKPNPPVITVNKP